MMLAKVKTSVSMEPKKIFMPVRHRMPMDPVLKLNDEDDFALLTNSECTTFKKLRIACPFSFVMSCHKGLTPSTMCSHPSRAFAASLGNLWLNNALMACISVPGSASGISLIRRDRMSPTPIPPKTLMISDVEPPLPDTGKTYVTLLERE